MLRKQTYSVIFILFIHIIPVYTVVISLLIILPAGNNYFPSYTKKKKINIIIVKNVFEIF